MLSWQLYKLWLRVHPRRQRLSLKRMMSCSDHRCQIAPSPQPTGVLQVQALQKLALATSLPRLQAEVQQLAAQRSQPAYLIRSIVS